MLARNMQRAAGQEENCFEAGGRDGGQIFISLYQGTGAAAGAAVALCEDASHFRSLWRLWSLFGSQGLQLPGNCAVLVKTPPPGFVRRGRCWVEKERKKKKYLIPVQFCQSCRVLSDCNHKHPVPIATSLFRAQAGPGVGSEGCVCVCGRGRGFGGWGSWFRGRPRLVMCGGRRGSSRKERRGEASSGPTRFYFIL